MARVVCGVDEAWEASREAVAQAVSFCRERGADLQLVGAVADRLSDSTRATPGERMRRYRQVAFALTRGAEMARAASLATTTTVEPGDVAQVALAQARAQGAEAAFFARRRSRLSAALKGLPAVAVERVILAEAEEATARERVA
jgi:hypothetical protein